MANYEPVHAFPLVQTEFVYNGKQIYSCNSLIVPKEDQIIILWLDRKNLMELRFRCFKVDLHYGTDWEGNDYTNVCVYLAPLKEHQKANFERDRSMPVSYENAIYKTGMLPDAVWEEEELALLNRLMKK